MTDVVELEDVSLSSLLTHRTRYAVVKEEKH